MYNQYKYYFKLFYILGISSINKYNFNIYLGIEASLA